MEEDSKRLKRGNQLFQSTDSQVTLTLGEYDMEGTPRYDSSEDGQIQIDQVGADKKTRPTATKAKAKPVQQHSEEPCKPQEKEKATEGKQRGPKEKSRRAKVARVLDVESAANEQDQRESEPPTKTTKLWDSLASDLDNDTAEETEKVSEAGIRVLLVQKFKNLIGENAVCASPPVCDPRSFHVKPISCFCGAF